jgi:hypothetical protein
LGYCVKSKKIKNKKYFRSEHEVSSTVCITSPEHPALVETNPVVWHGDINMPDVAKFAVNAHQVLQSTQLMSRSIFNGFFNVITISIASYFQKHCII